MGVAVPISLTEDYDDASCAGGLKQTIKTGSRLRPLRKLACVYAEAKPQ